MTEPYTPTTEEVRTDYVMAYEERQSSQLLAGMAFDRWFLQEIEKAEYSGYLRAVQDVDNTRYRFGTGDA